MKKILSIFSTRYNKAVAAGVAVPVIPQVIDILMWLISLTGIATPPDVLISVETLLTWIVGLGLSAGLIFLVPNKENNS